MIARLLPVAALLLAAAPPARADGQVLVVDPLGLPGSDYTTIQGAVLGAADVARSEAYLQARAVFGEMLAAYRQQDFDAAEKTILRCREAAGPFGLDRLVDIYTLRIAGFQKEAPPADWNGVFALETK